MSFSDWEHTRNGRGTPGYTPWPEGPTREEPSAGTVHTVFSVDGSLYQRWQADLLAYSHRRARQAGPLTRLLSSFEEAIPFSGRTFQTGLYSPHPLSGDDYAAYNKPAALKAWLQENPPSEEAILILDPDCVFLEPLTGPVSRGHPVAQPYSYLDPKAEDKSELVEKHCQRPELVDGVGIPLLIHRDDLAAVTSSWLRKTVEIRRDRRSQELVGWVAEMWAYAFAAAELGLKHTARELTRVTTEDAADLPIIHYCYGASDAEGNWRWDKWNYSPWERVPDPPDNVPLASKVLIGLLNEWVAKPGHQVCLY
jgi:hypothetical protein